MTWKSTGLVLFTVALWAGNPVATRFSTDALPPITVSGLRFFMATLVMIVWCRIERVSFRLQWEQLPAVLIAGVLLFLQISLFTIGTQWTSTSHASLLVNSFVFWVVGLEHFLLKSVRLTASKTAGLLLAGGAVLILLWHIGRAAAPTQRDMPYLSGDLILLFSAFLLGVKFIYTKLALKVIGPTELIFWHDIVAVALFALTGWFFEDVTWGRVSISAWLGLLYQGILVGGVCFALQAHLLKHHSATQIAVFSFLTPLFGMILGWLLRGDQLSPWLLVASVAVAGGIYLVNRAK
ncbi:MAG: DMT family transporter [Planctomycetaceae bacterium]